MSRITLTRLLPVACIAALVIATTPANAQFKNAKHAVEYRQGAFKVMALHFSNIGAMVNGKKPFDAAQAAFDVNVVQTISALPWVAFGDDTESLNSDARPEIWLEKDKFLAASKKLQTATATLAETARTGDAAKLKVAFGETARSCKACHDAYKN